MFLADSCCFLNGRGQPPIATDGLDLNLAIVTATPPTLPSESGGGRPLTMEETFNKIKEFKDSIASQSRSLRLVLNHSDLTDAIANKKAGIVLGLQNIPVYPDPKSLFDVGIRIMSLAYYGKNSCGSGFLNGGVGLTNFGRNFLRKCAEVGMIIDLSHVGYQTALDIISFIKENHLECRIMASHSGCVAEYHHLRNILDDVMRGIVDLGGVVGITTITFNLDEKDNSSRPFIKHLSHALKICGENNVCIGTDSVYVKRTLREAEEGIKRLRPWLDPLDIQGIRHPENIYEGPDLMKKIYKDLLDEAGFTEPYLGFVHGRFTSDQIEKIIGLNLLNFLKRTLPA